VKRSDRTADNAGIEARAIELFGESLALPTAEREAWIESRAGDDELLIDYLRELIQAEARSSGFLDRQLELRMRTDRSGRRIGAYTILAEYAIGGMSTVYRGQRSDGRFEQQVAIKVFDAVHLRGDMAARFAAERRILAALEHPAIARVVDGGELEDGTPYLVMEWIEGEAITRYCHRHRLDLPGRLNLFCRVCEALSLAHERGVVHRDIKPGNVLVNAAGDPKLIDFGIAKRLIADDDEPEMPETRFGMQLMTPEYASPEQVRGGEVGPASDVYSLGVLLYELLTGMRPYQLAGLSPAEIERAVCDSIAVRPSAMVAGSRDHPPSGLGESSVLKRRLRGDLDRIVMSAMRQEPDRRYATVAALSDDIQRYLANKPVRARGSSRLYRMGKFIARHRAGVGATGIAFAALMTALILVQLQAQEAREQAERAELASQFLTEMIGRADPFASAAEPTLASALRASIPDIASRFSDQPGLEADMRYAIGYALQSLGQIPEARVQLERAQRLRDQFDDPIDQAQAYDAMGIVHWWESDFAGASTWFQRALERLDGQRSEHAERQRFNVLNNFSAMLIETGEFERSAELAYAALELVDSSEVEFALANQATLWSNLATTLEGLDDFEGSESAFERSLAIRREAGAEMTPDYAITLNNLAYLHLRQDRFDEAIAGQTRSVEILEQTLGETHPEVFVTSMNLSRMLVQAGDLTQAEAYAERALDIGRATMDETNPRLGKAYEASALVREGQGRRAEALALAERTRQIYLDAEEVNPAWLEAIEGLIERLRHRDD